ncbi:MAG: hypothetical protein AAGJ46_18985 [Planctomycetota bacterium]
MRRLVAAIITLTVVAVPPYPASLLACEIDGVPVFFRADLTGDCRVDLIDLDILGIHFNGPGEFVQGDINGDGRVDVFDLDIMAREFFRGPIVFAFDTLGRGVTRQGGGEGLPQVSGELFATAEDDAGVACGGGFGGCPGGFAVADFNGDGVSDIFDLDILGRNFLMPGGFSDGDATGDGFVDIFDLDTIGLVFCTKKVSDGGEEPWEAAPEPTTMSLAAVVALMTPCRRRK